jgi:hypothetical protein
MWDIQNRLIIKVNEWLEVLSKSIEEKSPTDTKKYIKWNKVIKAIKSWSKVIWKVYNDSEYWQKVEFGWRANAVNWHKWPPRNAWTRIFTWQGARVYTRTKDEKEQEVINIIKNLW